MGILKMDVKRAFCGSRFPLAVLAVALIWYGNSRRFAMNEDVLSIFFDTTGRSTVTYLSLILCHVVYGLSVCEDLQDHELTHILGRVNVRNYTLSRIFVCICSNLAAYCAGTFLYLLFELTRHPLVAEGGYLLQNLQEITTFSRLLPHHTWLFLFLQCAAHGICCSCMSTLAVALSAYIRDGFIVLCLPLIFFYLFLFVSDSILKLSLNTEFMFFVISTQDPPGMFFLRIAVFALNCYILSAVVLYFGIRKRKCYA